MSKFHVATALLLSLAFSALAHAADDATRGFYIGVGAGQANLSLEDEDTALDLNGNDVGFKAIVGYRIIKYVAVEASYADYGTQDDTLLGFSIEGDFKSYYVTGVGLLPLGNTDLFAKAGIARWDGTLRSTDLGVSVSENNIDAIIGIGAQYRAGNVAFRGEVEGLMLGFDDDGDGNADGDDWITFISLGVTFTF